MESTRARLARLKAIRQGGADEKPRKRSPARKTKPWTLVYRLRPFSMYRLFSLFSLAAWSRFGSYRTEEEMDKVVSNMERKHPSFYEFRKFPTLEDARAWVHTENERLRNMRKNRKNVAPVRIPEPELPPWEC